MFALVIGLSATGLAASLGVGLARSRQRQRRRREALGIPACATNSAQSARNLRAMREFGAVEARIRERSPHLSGAQRRELAVNLIRARGLTPADDRQSH